MLHLVSHGSLATLPGVGNCQAPVNPGKFPATDFCYGLGEYSVGAEVTHTKCPQLNLRDYKQPLTGKPTKVLVRECINAAGKPSSGADCFSVKTAVWEPKQLTGIGNDGYWTDFNTDPSTALYGWTEGVLPDFAPLNNTPNVTRIDIGQAVLCRDKDITKAGVVPPGTFPAGTVSCDAANNPDGCWMQGQIVGNSYDPNTWVCKLDDGTRGIIPHTIQANIRQLCFAKTSDHQNAEAKGMKGFDPNWRAKGPNGCDCKLATCPTCCPYCRRGITDAGYNCPKDIGLGDEVLNYDMAVTHLYTPGLVSGIFFTDPTMKALSLQVDGKTIVPQWGPQPGGKNFLMKKTPSVNITTTSFGRYVLCPSSKGATTYKGGSIFNTPLQTTDTFYHVDGCDNEDFDPTKAMKCTPGEMLDLCYPKTL